ncbi:MAG: hypothetical protein EXR27_02970 [Betaproteobacteria bacterium]|nr:hypothetical protein [Betaproteobacteria bacterium]
MLTTDQNERLTRVGPGTPMGNLFRRYWLPVLLSEELPAPDCAPVPVRILCEDLVAFRDTQGRVGLLHDACPHRGASLSFGRNEQGGLRCIFHGWKFDLNGACVDMPNYTGPANAKPQIVTTAYPTREAGGAVWAYMGPAATMPPFREFGWMAVPPAHRGVWKVLHEANFLQGMERDLDTVHTPIHRTLKDDEAKAGKSLLEIVRSELGSSTMEVERTGYGLRSVAVQPANDGQDYIRITPFVMPAFLFVWPVANSGDGRGFAFVPRDDTSCWHFIHLYNADKPIDPGYRRTRGLEGLDTSFRKLRNIDNRYLQDRDAMKSRSYNGVQGIIIEDHMLAEIQGPVVDRSREHLLEADLPVVELRRILLEALEICAAGGELPGLDPFIPYVQIGGRDYLKPAATPWKTISPAEDAGIAPPENNSGKA